MTFDIVQLCEVDIDVIDGDRGKNYPHQDELLESGYCLFLSAKNVTQNGFLFSDRQFITQEKDELLNNGKLMRGDIVITTRGTIGNVAIYSDEVPYDIIESYKTGYADLQEQLNNVITPAMENANSQIDLYDTQIDELNTKKDTYNDLLDEQKDILSFFKTYAGDLTNATEEQKAAWDNLTSAVGTFTSITGFDNLHAYYDAAMSLFDENYDSDGTGSTAKDLSSSTSTGSKTTIIDKAADFISKINDKLNETSETTKKTEKALETTDERIAKVDEGIKQLNENKPTWQKQLEETSSLSEKGIPALQEVGKLGNTDSPLYQATSKTSDKTQELVDYVKGEQAANDSTAVSVKNTSSLLSSFTGSIPVEYWTKNLETSQNVYKAVQESNERLDKVAESMGSAVASVAQAAISNIRNKDNHAYTDNRTINVNNARFDSTDSYDQFKKFTNKYFGELSMDAKTGKR